MKEEDESEQQKFGKQQKTKPMNLIRRQKEEHAYFLQLADKDKEKLRAFIRLVDYLVIQTLVRVNLQSMSILYQEMCRDARKQGGLFNSMVRFDPEGLSFSPDNAEIADSLQGILTDMIKVAQATTRILYYHGFESVIQTATQVDIF